MLRTRDFVLFLVIFGFLLCAVFATLAHDARQGDGTTLRSLILGTHAARELEVAKQQTQDTREENIATLRQKIAAGEGTVSGEPPVFTSVDDVPPEEAITSEDDTTRSVMWCQGAALSASTQTSELLDVVVTSTQITLSRNATNVEGSTTAQVAAIFDRTQQPQGVGTCIDDNRIGITQDGRWIENTQALLYQQYFPNELVGYARDGFPIYGPVSDPETLDGCGGRMTGSGYQYHVRTDEDFVLGCFAATPAAL